MLNNSILKYITLALGLVAASVMAQTPYDDGQLALRELRWLDAAEQFKAAIGSDQANAEAAMYWRAHALYKAGRNKEAGRQVRDLVRRNPDSHWVREAKALQIEYDTPAAVDEPGLDEELRMFALVQLMEQHPGRAFPLVEKLLQESESENVREHALFMLGMSDDPRAYELVANAARDASRPGMQVDAIRMLGMAGIDRSGALLGELYHDAASHEVREAVIHSYLASDEPAPLVRLLKSETDAALQREIIQVLGAMDASAEISEIYPKLQDKESKIAAIEAFSVGGGSEMLHDLLASETDPELRRAAIVGIAVDGDTGSAALLESLYASASSPEEKSGILEALQIMGSGTDLALNIIRTEADPGLKRQAIEALAVMGANTQLRTLYSTLEDTESRAVVLNALAIAEDSAALMDILQAETNPDLRARAIDSLSVSGGSGVTEYLVSIYPQVSRDEKHAVIQSLMIDGNASRLINLIGQETDPEMKREMLRALAMMDTEESQNFLFELLESEQ